LRARAERALAVAAAAACLAAAPGAGGVQAIRSALDEAQAAQASGAARPERLAAVREAARRVVDTRTMGRAAIGSPVLDAQPPAAQEEYLRHFDVLIMRSWMQKLLLFKNPRFEFAALQTRDGSSWVATRIVTAHDTYRIDYAVERREGRWWATDIVVEDLSLVESYRSQIASLLETRSFDELLALMRRKTERLRARDAR
jgi:phospholipid transport system substrate-binding protein